MTKAMPHGAERLAALGVEMDRVEALAAAVERHRAGKALGEDGRTRIARAQDGVQAGRRAGHFAALAALIGEDPDTALDCLMIVAFPLVRPSRARMIAALDTAPSGEPGVTQGLLHELLMPDDAAEARLALALAPTAAMIRAGLIRAEGQGPTRVLRPGFALARFVAGTEARLQPPEGVRLVHKPGDPLPPMLQAPRTAARLSDVERLIAHVAATGAMAGPAILFTGGPGTGKSLSVFHMAERLGRPLYQIDLGRVVSKWMGETERNLSRIFEEMSGTEGMILIDEADALLGKRVEVRESRDQHANLTVSHLLSLFERHRGPVFATTNLRGNLDGAYIRRFAAVVEFHRPDRALRRALWEAELERRGVPGARALAGLAAHPDLTAAEIVNAATLAAALAETPQTLDAARLAAAILMEKAKGDATFGRDDLGPLAPVLPGEGRP